MKTSIISNKKIFLSISLCILMFSAQADMLAEQKIQATQVDGHLPDLRADISDIQKQAKALRQTKQFSVIKPMTGTLTGLTILVKFPGDPLALPYIPQNADTERMYPQEIGAVEPFPKEAIEDFLNKDRYKESRNSYSIKGYFYQQSFGKLTYRNILTNYLIMPHPKAYYSFSNYGASNYPEIAIFRTMGESGGMVTKDALDILSSNNFDFSPLSSRLRPSSAGDVNRIISINILIAGYGSNSFRKGFWSHMGAIRDYDVSGPDEKKYAFYYQLSSLGTTHKPAPHIQSKLSIGTFCHESGHLILNYGDYYSGSGYGGIGAHGLMASGGKANGRTNPAPINAYLKYKSGWIKPIEISSNDAIDNAKLPMNSHVVYKYTNPSKASEYFLIEAKQNVPGDTTLPDSGIAVWHIDETKFTVMEPQMTATQHYELSLIQADGKAELERNRFADSDDYFDKESVNTLDYTTNPDTRWWDGSDSGLRISDIGKIGGVMTVDFGYVINGIPAPEPPPLLTKDSVTVYSENNTNTPVIGYLLL